MSEMFCFQCEQTAKGTGCTMSGVCGKKPNVAHEQDVLTCEMIGLAKASDGRKEHVDLIVDGLFVTITNVNFDEGNVDVYAGRIHAARESVGGGLPLSTENLFHGDENVVSLRSTLLFGLRGMAAYAHHARVLGKRDSEVDAWFIKGMAVHQQGHSVSPGGGGCHADLQHHQGLPQSDGAGHWRLYGGLFDYEKRCGGRFHL